MARGGPIKSLRELIPEAIMRLSVFDNPTDATLEQREVLVLGDKSAVPAGGWFQSHLRILEATDDERARLKAAGYTISDSEPKER